MQHEELAKEQRKLSLLKAIELRACEREKRQELKESALNTEAIKKRYYY